MIIHRHAETITPDTHIHRRSQWTDYGAPRSIWASGARHTSYCPQTKITALAVAAEGVSAAPETGAPPPPVPEPRTGSRVVCDAG